MVLQGYKTVVWYRLCFDPKKGISRFEDSATFERWLRNYFSDFEYENAGYIICPAHEVINSKGVPLWNIIIEGKNTQDTCDLDILAYLSKHDWVIDNRDVLFYIKYQEKNERLFPSRGITNA